MARINTRAGREAEKGGPLLPPGTYLVEVAQDAAEKTSKKGDAYFALTFRVVEGPYTGQILCKDSIMLEGGGFGIGMVKLRMLGVDVDKGDELEIGATALIGMRARLTVDVQTYSYAKQDGTVANGRNLKPTGDGKHGFGYAPAEGVAPAAEEEPALPPDDDVPF